MYRKVLADQNVNIVRDKRMNGKGITIEKFLDIQEMIVKEFNAPFVDRIFTKNGRPHNEMDPVRANMLLPYNYVTNNVIERFDTETDEDYWELLLYVCTPKDYPNDNNLKQMKEIALSKGISEDYIGELSSFKYESSEYVHSCLSIRLNQYITGIRNGKSDAEITEALLIRLGNRIVEE